MWQFSPGQFTNVAALMPSGFLPETQALLARFSTPATSARAILINTLIGSLISAGVWSKLDALYVMAAADAQTAALNWVASQYNLTEVLVPTFTTDRGYTPDGVASYLDSGFNPTTAVAAKFTLNDAHMAGWHLTANAASFDIGNSNSRIIYNPSLMSVRANNATSVTNAGSYTTHKVWSRSGAALWEAYIAGSDVGGGTGASTSLFNLNFGIGRTGTAGAQGSNQVSIVHFGSNLTAGEVLAAYNALLVYMQGVGAA